MREAIPPLPQYVFVAWCLVKHRDNVTFLISHEVKKLPAFYGTRGFITVFIKTRHWSPCIYYTPQKWLLSFPAQFLYAFLMSRMLSTFSTH
jgi:hypothetical protein